MQLYYHVIVLNVSCASFISSIEGVDPSEIECVFSPAKKRGPVPGRTGLTRKLMDDTQDDVDMTGVGSGSSSMQQPVLSGSYDEFAMRQVLLQQQSLSGLSGLSNYPTMMVTSGGGLMDASGGASQIQQRNYLHQLDAGALSGGAIENDMNPSQGRVRRFKTEGTDGDDANAPDTVAAHIPLLGRDSIDGNRLRAFYRLSVDELYVLPPIPSDEEYCARHNLSISLLPGSHRSALNAARFAEIALGAVVHNEVALAMELCNAVVHTLRDCMKAPVKPEYAFEVARAYFLLGAFRAFRGDMVRYFKYRRASMLHLSKLGVSCICISNGP